MNKGRIILGMMLFSVVLTFLSMTATAWYGNYNLRRTINCTNSLGHPVVVNGSDGFNIIGGQQIIWINCSETSIYVYYNTTDYVFANSGDVALNFDVEKGNETSVTPTDVWTDTNSTFHMGDVSGSKTGVDLSIVNNAGFETDGFIWNKSTFDGTNDYFTISNGAPLDTYSVSVWLNATDTGTHEDLVDWRSPTNGEYIFRINANGGATDDIQFYTFSPGAESCIEVDGFAGLFGNWNLLTATYDGTNARLWVNATLIKTCAITAPAGNPGTAFHKISSDSWDYSGKMDEFREWTTNISAEYIATMYYNPLGISGYGDLGAEEIGAYSSYTETYNTSGREGTVHIFTLEIEGATSEPYANFSWNGTVYENAGKSNVSTNYTFFKSITLPEVDGAATVQFNWTFSINGSSTSLTDRTFTIYNINITNCSGAGETTFATFFLLDEITNASIDNGTIDVTFFTDDYGDYPFAFADVDDNVTFCVNPAGTSLTVDMNMDYDHADYGARYYTLDDAVLTNTSTNFYLYLLNSSESHNTTFTVQDENFAPFIGASLYVMKVDYGTNSYYTVTSGVTNSDGETKLEIAWDTWYKFNVVRDGVTYLVNGDSLEDQTPVRINTDAITVSIDTRPDVEYLDEYKNIIASCTTNLTTNVTRCAWSTVDGTQKEACLNVTSFTWNTTTSALDSCETSNSGTISYTYTSGTNYRFIFSVYSGGVVVYTETGGWSSTVDPLFDDWSVFLAFIFIVTFAFGGFMIGAGEGIFLATIATVFTGLIGLLAISVYWMIGIFAVGLIGAYVMRR